MGAYLYDIYVLNWDNPQVCFRFYDVFAAVSLLLYC